MTSYVSPYITQLQRNYGMPPKGVNTGTGQRDVAPPTTSVNPTLEEKIDKISKRMEEQSQKDRDFWRPWIEQTQADEYAATDRMSSKKRNALQDVLSFNTQDAMNRAGYDNRAKDSPMYDHFLKEEEHRRASEINSANQNGANFRQQLSSAADIQAKELEANASRYVADRQYQGQVEAARSAADASKYAADASASVARTNAAASLYSNYVARNGDYRFW